MFKIPVQGTTNKPKKKKSAIKASDENLATGIICDNSTPLSIKLF